MGRKLTDDERLARMAVERARKEWGLIGWSRLSDHQRTSEVARGVLSIVMGWSGADRITAAEVQALTRAAYLLVGQETGED